MYLFLACSLSLIKSQFKPNTSMRKSIIFTICLITVLALTKPSFAQKRTPVSAEDKAAIIELFKDVPKSQYR
jgi:hypothetical protein